MFGAESSHWHNQILNLTDLLSPQNTDRGVIKYPPHLSSYFSSSRSDHKFKVPFPPSSTGQKLISAVKILHSEIGDKFVISETDAACERTDDQAELFEGLKSLGRILLDIIKSLFSKSVRIIL